jgi:hypothetical protein
MRKLAVALSTVILLGISVGFAATASAQGAPNEIICNTGTPADGWC